MKNKRKLKNLYKAMIGIIALGISCVALLGTLILSEVDTVVDDANDVDYALILGAGLIGDQVSDRLRIRLDAAVEVLADQDVKIIVSGGQGPAELVSEAEAMRKYLVDRGIDPQRIIKEEASTSTQENIKYSNEIISDEDAKVLIITSDYHMYRALMLGNRIGWDATGHSAVNPLEERLRRMVREVLALAKDILIRTY